VADLRLVADDATPEQIAAERDARPSWLNKLSRRKNGTLLPLSRNAELILVHDDRWQGVIAWDDFRQSIVFRRPAPWDPDVAPATEHTEWTDTDTTRLQGWLSQHHQLHLGREIAEGALKVAAERTSYHEVREYLSDLKWDGSSRVRDWATRYLGAVPGQYSELVSRYYLTSAVARVMEPGCKADCMIVLEGEQGARKSTALATLFGDAWFSDTPLDLESKDRFGAIQGCWCCEWAELDAMRRVDLARIKSFLSSKVDKYRPPYGRTDVRVPRQCVCAGTTNPETYLQDPTGARRFWPIKCGTIRIEQLEADRDQIWAEAVTMWESYLAERARRIRAPECRWWPETPTEKRLLAGEQAARMEPDPWDNVVADWLEARREMSWVLPEDIYSDCLGLEKGKWDRRHETRVGKIISLLGWQRKRRRVKGDPRWVYLPPEPDDPTQGEMILPDPT
jgi:putative DNA primase/helicase